MKTSQGAQGVFTSASTASGTADGKSVDFTAKGSYGGQKIAKSGNYIFYYANDKFYNNQNLYYSEQSFQKFACSLANLLHYIHTLHE